MLTYVRTSLFDSPAQTLVNTVNTVGVMGKGIALQFKDRYPDMFKAYKKLCDSRALDIGKLHLWRAADHWVLNFPTKTTWRQPSQIEYIEKGLDTFQRAYKEMGISSVSFPPLGCGNGNLSWVDVKPLMERYLSRLEIPVYIHDRQVPKNFVPEHDDTTSSAVPISYVEFIADIASRINNKKPFSTLNKTSEFSARISDACDIIVNRSGRHDLIDHQLVEAAWSALQNGIFTGDQFPDDLSRKLKSYLFPILAELPYVEVAEIAKPGWSESNAGHALYFNRNNRRNFIQRDSLPSSRGDQACLSL